MRRRLVRAFLLIGFLLATIPLAADSFVRGDVEGIELCPKFICGVAVFAGEFEGTINGVPKRGIFVAAIDHQLPLPVVEDGTALITGGVFSIRLPFRTIRGVVVDGILTKNANETFDVEMTLLVTTPTGPVVESFTGLLRHDVPIPTIGGTIE